MLKRLGQIQVCFSKQAPYRSPSSPSQGASFKPVGVNPLMPAWITAEAKTPGVCIPWGVKARELPPFSGDPGVARRVWDDIEGLAYLYIWHLLLSF